MKTAIIGGAGEIGARMSQNFLLSGTDVRIISRRKSPRIARWGNVDFAPAELPLAEHELQKVLDGCEVVVNCVVDKKAFDSADRSIASNTQGLKNLIEASVRMGVKKFIHLSTIAVLPPRLTPSALEHPFDYSKETDWYTRVKIETEKTALEYRDRINLCVLRPGIVYGPYMFWSRIAFERVLNYIVVIPEVQDSVCHAVHVDDLVGLIGKLIHLPDRLPELLYGVNPEPVSWRHYFELHANALGFYDEIISQQPEADIRAHYAAQKKAEAGGGIKERTLQRLRKLYGRLPRVLTNNPFSTKMVEVLKVLNRGLPFYTQLHLPPPKACLYPSEFELELYSSTAVFKPEITGARHGYHYQIPFSEGVKGAAAWWNFQV